MKTNEKRGENMKFNNKIDGFREKNVIRKRIIPDIVGFKDMENVLENNQVLNNKVHPINDNNNTKLE